MRVKIKPSVLAGSVYAPPSKSAMQRACAAALIRKGTSRILEAGKSDDENAALDIIQKLGAKVEVSDQEIIVKSKGVNPVDDEINCGESGLSIRMFVPIAALSDKTIKITGSGSLIDRPMSVFDEVFPKLNVEIQSDRGKLPLVINGPLIPGNIEIDGSLSSQFLTGLIFAFSAAGAVNKNIKVNDLKSRPYIDLTLEILQEFKLPVPENNNYESFRFRKSDITDSTEIIYTVEKDWSGAAFLLVAGAIAGPVIVRGLNVGSNQADKAIMEALFKANASVAVEAKGIRVRPAEMNGFDFDARDCPDLFPPLAVLATQCKGDTRILGVNRLLHKESNRAVSLVEELSKMNAVIGIENDTMIITGGNKLQGAVVHSHHDHRIAMALAVAALKAEGKTIIHDAESITKSYPGFFEDLRLIGAYLTLHKDE